MGQWSEIDQRGAVGPVEKSATCRAFRMKTFGLMGVQLIFVLAPSAAWTRWAILIHIEHVLTQRVLGKWEKKLRKLWSIKLRGSPFSEKSSLRPTDFGTTCTWLSIAFVTFIWSAVRHGKGTDSPQDGRPSIGFEHFCLICPEMFW